MPGHAVKVFIDGGNNQTFYPGSHMTGRVEYRAPLGVRLNTVTLDFRGTTKVDPGRRSKRQTEFVELFHMHETLLSDPLLINSTSLYHWQFAFSFPLETGPDRSGKYADGGNPQFNDKPHKLPPALGANQSNETRVEYLIYAVASAAWQMSLSPVVCSVVNLNFSSDVERRTPQPQHVIRIVSMSDARKRRFSLRKSASLPGSELDPTTFSVVADMPSEVDFGDMITMSFKTSESTYGLNHKSTSLSLEILTYRRTAKEPHTKEFTETKTVKIGDASGTGVLASDRAVPLHFAVSGIKQLPPSFKSYSVSRAYNFILIINITVGKEESDVRFEAPVEVVKFASMEAILSRRALNMPPPPPPDLNDESLPAYARYA